MFYAQRGKTLDETFRVNWNESLAHSYPRTIYAAVQFWFNQNIDSANIVLKEYGQYFIDKATGEYEIDSELKELSGNNHGQCRRFLVIQTTDQPEDKVMKFVPALRKALTSIRFIKK